MAYIDVMVAAVPTARKDEYLHHSKTFTAILQELGAIGSADLWGDDVPEGKLTSFPLAVKAEPDETVCVGWIRWPDKATRDRGMKAMMEDPRVQPDVLPMPFDGKRMIFGGFEPVCES